MIPVIDKIEARISSRTCRRDGGNILWHQVLKGFRRNAIRILKFLDCSNQNVRILRHIAKPRVSYMLAYTKRDKHKTSKHQADINQNSKISPFAEPHPKRDQAKTDY